MEGKNSKSRDLWKRFRKHYCYSPALEMGLDVSRMRFPRTFLEKMAGPMQSAFQSMKELEAGAIANPDENRQVGHYWLRAPDLAPTPAIAGEIKEMQSRVKSFAGDVHSGKIRPEKAEKFREVLVIGIGGSALGPQLAADALGGPGDPMGFHSIDNTDPDGIARVLGSIGPALTGTLTLVVSKSGGTKETRNGMLEAHAAYRAAGLQFEKHAVAVTGTGSALDQQAAGWLARFPMWDWVGGRTSEMSAVGLLPAALQGLDIDGLLAGARAMDEATRVAETARNPAALLALMWHYAGRGKGLRDMVVLPYKDRLLLFSRYLQQLVMESLGKKCDLRGQEVHQGIAVYGNKGSTDQHAYVQQLRDGINNFFVTFIEVQEDMPDGGRSLEVEPGRTPGDYLGGFLRGTREALTDGGRESITIVLRKLGAAGLGKLIALFERAVGFYGSLVEINAYHQPGVEAGKKAAEEVLALQEKVLAGLRAKPGKMRDAEKIAREIGESDRAEMVFHLLERMSANPADKGVVREPGEDPFHATYGIRDGAARAAEAAAQPEVSAATSSP
jgi:glucose-6-phosphate isomerase